MNKIKFSNILLSNRLNLTPKESTKALIEYALIQDTKSRSRVQNRSISDTFIPFLICLPVVYFFYDVTFGKWAEAHKDIGMSMISGKVGISMRKLTRPEIFLRQAQSEYYELEKENIKKEKKGEKSLINSPLAFWH